MSEEHSGDYAALAAEADERLPTADAPHRSHHAVLIGGQYGGRKVGLSGAPPRIDVGGLVYVRIDDPDTGEYLGGYAFTTAGERR